MNSDDINRELEAMWARVHKTDVPAPQPVPGGSTPLTTGERGGSSVIGEFQQNTTADVVRILKRQHRESELQWRDMLAAKDKETEALRERLRDLEARAEAMSREITDREQETLTVSIQAQAWAEEQQRAVASLKAAHQQEMAALVAAADEVKEKLRQLTAGRERQANEFKRKEEDLLARIRDLEEAPDKLKKELVKRESQLNQSTKEGESARKRAAESLAELQEAVRRSTEELLRERGVRKEAEEARARLDSELALLKETHERMKAAWAEERKQWSELWDRERSTWEAQRLEMRQWEDDLRRQRDEWLQAVRERPAAVAVVAPTEEVPSPGLRPTSPEGRGEELIGLLEDLPWRWIGVGFAAVAVIAAGVWGVRALSSKIYLKLEATSPLALESPTALAYDGAHLWAGSWTGRLAVFDPANPGAPLWQSMPRGLGPFRPGGLAIGDGALWSLDAAQVRVLKHDPRNPSRLLWHSRDGGVPAAVAHDGRRLWVFDGGDRHLFRYRADPKLGPEESYDLAPGLLATSMQWNGKDLWLFDALNDELWRYRFDGDAFKFKSRDRLPSGTAAVALSDRQLWAVVNEGGKASLRRYRRVYP